LDIALKIKKYKKERSVVLNIEINQNIGLDYLIMDME